MTKNRTNASTRILAILLVMAVFLPHQAASENPEQYGTLNPEELSPNATLAKVKRGRSQHGDLRTGLLYHQSRQP